MATTSNPQAKTNNHYVVWKAEYGGWESNLLTTEPVTATEANSLVMKESLEYVQTHDSAEIENVDTSGDVQSVMVEKNGTTWKWYAKGFETAEAAQESIEAWDPRDV